MPRLGSSATARRQVDLGSDRRRDPHASEAPVDDDDTRVRAKLRRVAAYFTPEGWLKLGIFFALLGLARELEVMAVYLVVAAMYALYTSMQPGTRKKGELSAYAAFNPGFRRLDGETSAEEMTRQMTRGIAGFAARDK